jgi:phosphoribosylglycinamide formyltransferase-1
LKSGRDVSAAVVISGGGTNLQAFIDAVGAGQLDLDLAVVISNNPAAGGLRRAQGAGIDTLCVDNKMYAERARFDDALASGIDRYRPDLVILAGFMRRLGRAFVARYAGRMLNIHPSLLPKYPGLNTHARALQAAEQWHGSTVHFVTDELDGGPRIIQGRVPVHADDDVVKLAARVLDVEHKIYPRAAALFAAGRLSLLDGECWLDNKRLPEPLQYADD